MLAISNLNQSYGESHTLWDVELTVEEGTCTCLMGRNGVGKTTFLKALMGLLKWDTGSATFEGQDISQVGADHRAPRGIGYVPQGREIFPQLTVKENLEIGLLVGRTRGVANLDRIFELFPVLAQMLARRGGDLSGGQQQQLAIGRALALNPKLLVLDEPTEGIQPNVVSQIGDVLVQLKNSGMTILLVEQKLKFARRVADTFSIMDRGRMVAKGEIADLNDELVKRYLVV